MWQRRPQRAFKRTPKAVAAGLGLGLIAALSLVGTSAVATPSGPNNSAALALPTEAVLPPTDGLIAGYLFDQTTGSTIANTVSGGAPATVENAADSQWTGTSLTFTGGGKNSNANWVRLPNDLLKDSGSATVVTEVKIDASMKNAYNFLWNIGSTSTNEYYFASVRDGIRTAITTTSGGGEVNARGGSLEADRWYNLTSVIDGSAGTISLFLDGEFISKTPTTLQPRSVTNQTLNTIGRAPYPDPHLKGEVSAFSVYDRALTAAEIKTVSEFTAQPHADSFTAVAQALLDSIKPLKLDDTVTVLPDYNGQIVWDSSEAGIEIGQDGRTATVALPESGQDPVLTSLTATATVRGIEATIAVPVTLVPQAAATDDYGYLMVHFVEDSQGYAEKIYLDISRGNNAEQWDPLNSGKPILASDLGTTGIRDPYITYNPETGTYYIIATDLRVFGGDNGSGNCTSWCHWSSQGSTKLNIWESTDLVTWSEQRQIDLATNLAGDKVAELGMAWAPEATWVPNYYGAGKGAFVLYWSSNMYTNDNPGHTGSSYSRILWGATPDFTADSYEYGGVFIDHGGNTIDTTMTQVGDTTYRVTKDNTFGKGLYMESTTDAQWWLASANWTEIQDKIGANWSGNNPGGVEGPAIFKKHNEDTWYLYVDVIPTVGYRPMVSQDLTEGWEPFVSSDFYMAPSTKHGGIIGLTKAQYNTVRQADAVSAVTPVLDPIALEASDTAADLEAALPATTQVNTAYDRGAASLPLFWDLSGLELGVPGDYEITGTVQSIGANLNDWAGKDGDTNWNAADRAPFSSTAITVTTTVSIAAAPVVPVPVDKFELQSAIDLAEALDQSLYTADTWGPLARELAVALGVHADADASQAQVDSATAALFLAHANLKKVADEGPGDGETPGDGDGETPGNGQKPDSEKPVDTTGKENGDGGATTTKPGSPNESADDLAKTGSNGLPFLAAALGLILLGAGAVRYQVRRNL